MGRWAGGCRSGRGGGRRGCGGPRCYKVVGVDVGGRRAGRGGRGPSRRCWSLGRSGWVVRPERYRLLGSRRDGSWGFAVRRAVAVADVEEVVAAADYFVDGGRSSKVGTGHCSGSRYCHSEPLSLQERC